jgi:hypothetical protein
VEALAGCVFAQEGHVDILHNNAGVGHGGNTEGDRGICPAIIATPIISTGSMRLEIALAILMVIAKYRLIVPAPRCQVTTPYPLHRISPADCYAYHLISAVPLSDHRGEVKVTAGGRGSHVRWAVRYRSRLPLTRPQIATLVQHRITRALAGLARARSEQTEKKAGDPHDRDHRRRLGGCGGPVARDRSSPGRRRPGPPFHTNPARPSYPSRSTP